MYKYTERERLHEKINNWSCATYKTDTLVFALHFNPYIDYSVITVNILWRIMVGLRPPNGEMILKTLLGKEEMKEGQDS
jgi:hypothetical protein